MPIIAVERRHIEMVVLRIGATVAELDFGRFLPIGEVDDLLTAVVGVDVVHLRHHWCIVRVDRELEL